MCVGLPFKWIQKLVVDWCISSSVVRDVFFYMFWIARKESLVRLDGQSLLHRHGHSDEVRGS